MTEWKRIQRGLDRGVEEGVFSGAMAGIARGEENVVLVTGQTRTGKGARNVSDQTLFDLASLTKVLAIGTIVARLRDRNELDLEKPLSVTLSDLTWNDTLKRVTAEDVLAHRAGLAAWCDFHAELRSDEQKNGDRCRQTILENIVVVEPIYVPGTTSLYSDLGFILLGAWLEKVTGRTLPDLLAEEVCRPLGCKTLMYRPVDQKISRDEIAATEESPWRGGVIQGDVHDNNAFLLGGIAGHAGLFGTASDCLRVGSAWLKSLEGQGSYLSRETVQYFVSLRGVRGLTWDFALGEESSAGTNVSPGTFGHLGYAGTSLWIDPQRKAVVTLLTNRVHPTSTNEKIKTFRPQFHDDVWKVIDG